MSNHSTPTETSDCISARIRDLSPGTLDDLFLKGQAQGFDLVRTQACFVAARNLSLCSSDRASVLVTTLPQCQLCDLFLAASARAQTERMFFIHFEYCKLEVFVPALLVIRPVLADYRGLVSVALDSFLSFLVIDSFATTPEGWSVLLRGTLLACVWGTFIFWPLFAGEPGER